MRRSASARRSTPAFVASKTMTELELRSPTIDDVAAMWRVRTAAIRDVSSDFYPVATTQHWANVEMPNDFSSLFESIDAIVCTHTSVLIGWGFANLNVAHIDALFVDPIWQRKGVGTLITKEFEKIARQKNLENLELSSTLNAVQFYRRLGFESYGEIPYNHPNGFSLPSVRMVKRL